MSLDVYLKDPTATYETEDLYSGNITHNLGEMAGKAGIYKALWRPYKLHKNWTVANLTDGNYDSELDFESKNHITAKDLIPVIEKGLEDLKARPDYFRQFDSPNGWGIYDHFVPFVEEYLEALKNYPEARVSVWR
jgi:hypothetical protein